MRPDLLRSAVLSFFAFFCASLTGPAPALADLTLEHSCYSTTWGTPAAMESPKPGVYTRKTMVREKLLVIQIHQKERLRKEYGFDFKELIYYEADPHRRSFKTFSLSRVNEEFETLKKTMAKASGASHPRKRILDLVTDKIVEGRVDFPVKARGAFFGAKEIAGLRASRVKLTMGPGGALMNPVGWFRKADVWVTRDFEGWEEYAGVVEALKEHGNFYKARANAVSDFIVTLFSVRGIPLEIRAVAKRRYGIGSFHEEDEEALRQISSRPIDETTILYFTERARFSGHVLFDAADRQLQKKRLGDSVRTPGWSEILDEGVWFLLPLLFVLGMAALIYHKFLSESVYPLGSRLLTEIYLIVALAFLVQLGHVFLDWPVVHSLTFEVMGMLVLGVLVIAGNRRRQEKALRRRMEDEQKKKCPYCEGIIDVFYVNCPKCNRDLPA